MRLSLFSAVLAASALLAAPASAQTTFLIKGGLNTAFFSGDDGAGTDPRLGVAAGAGLRFDVSPSLGVQVEALYSQEGAEDPDNRGTYKMDYLDVPILLRAALPLSPYADAGLYVGPQIGIPVRSDFVRDNGRVDNVDLQTDIGLTLGADYWSGPIGIDLRYTTGLTDAFENSNLDIRNQAFTVSLGYRFGGATYGRGRRGRY